MNPQTVKALTPMLVLAAALLLPRPLQAEEIQSLAVVESTAESFALDQLQDKHYSDLQVEATRLDSRLRLKPCDRPLEAFGSAGGEQTIRLTVGIRCSSNTPWTLYVPVQIRASIAVLTVTASLPRGTVLGNSNLALVNRPLQEVPANYLSDMAAASNMELTRPLAANTLLTPSMLQPAQLVNKGQAVTILADGENFAVKMTGTALQNGAAGQHIGVKNTTSGRTVQAVVLDAGTVRVGF